MRYSCLPWPSTNATIHSMRSKKPRRSPVPIVQIIIFFLILVGGFMIVRISQNTANLQQVQASEKLFQAELYAQETISAELVATLAYVNSEAYVEEFNRTEVNKILPGEVKVVPLISQATPQATPEVTPTPDLSSYAKPWQMWWYLLTDIEAPVISEQ